LITAVRIFFDGIKTLKKNSRVIYPKISVNYRGISTLEKEGFLIFLTDKKIKERKGKININCIIYYCQKLRLKLQPKTVAKIKK